MEKEAARRGLNVETNVPKMICEFTRPESLQMFTRTGVYSERELTARNEVKWEIYVKKVQIEARVMYRMAVNHIIPAAVEYKTALLKEVALSQQVYGNQDNCVTELQLLSLVDKHINSVRLQAQAIKEACDKAEAIGNTYEQALAFHEVAESFPALRRPIDKLEELVDNKLWPLPKYRELLFIN